MKRTLHVLLSRIYHNTLVIMVEYFKLRMYWFGVPKKVKELRRKPEITVLFVVTGIKVWKAYMLFQRMLQHPRFKPMIGVDTNPKYPESKTELINFLKKENIGYIDLEALPNSIDSVRPDIVIYDSPYTSAYTKGISFEHNLRYLFVGCDYCLSITKHIQHLKHKWYDYCWQFYVEHDDVKKRKIEILGNKASNIRVTAVPIQDELMMPKDFFKDPWKDKCGKKRIIYAPHHSFKGSNGDGIEFATFMEYHQFMLDMAKKYCDKITIAFKPHPFLYIKLLKIWGKEKTDAYYEEWKIMPNTQFENGEYFGLFKHSDAIIHDCASFIVEYLYTDNPSLFLVSESNNIEDMFDFVKESYDCYDHAHNKKEIETFIRKVIKGEDHKSDIRRSCIRKNLLPPNGMLACDNIINAILNE